MFEKLSEETQELQEHLKDPRRPIRRCRSHEIPPELREHVEDEVGDLFFVLVNIARYLSVDPESALRKTNRKFRRRFSWLEEQLRQQGRTPGTSHAGRNGSFMATGQNAGGTKP